MSKMIQCTACQTTISEQAKACPKCGAPNKKKGGCLKILGIGFLGFIVLIAIAGNAAKNSSPGTTVSSSTSTSSSNEGRRKPINIGDVVTTPKFEISVTSVSVVSAVGEAPFKSTASEGALYLAIKWEYKNVSGKPISSFSSPDLQIKDPNGNKYDADIGASASFGFFEEFRGRDG